MKRFLTTVILIFSLMSCSALNPLDALNPSKPSIDVTTAIGKDVHQEQEKSGIKLEQGTKNVKQKAEKIENGKQEADTIKNITQNMPLSVLLLIIGLAGLAIDGKGFLIQARKDVIGIIKFPFNFILSIFGRDKL